MPITQCTIFDCKDPQSPIAIASFGLDDHGDGHLAYGHRYIDQAYASAIDPLHLPLAKTAHVIPRHKDGSYGVLSDAGPNAWGVKLTSSIYRKNNTPLPATPVEWFLKSWHYGSGCLGFSENKSIMPLTGVTPCRVEELHTRQLDLIEALSKDPDTELDEEAVRLFFPGGSLGGMRPKTVVMHDGIEHIAKFSRHDDRVDVPTVEYASLRLAHAAGIDVTDFELIHVGERSVLLVARFDRTPDQKRIHYMSAHTLVNINGLSFDQREYKTTYSYAGIAELMRGINDNAMADSHALFRRMVFNIMIGNVDDHMRNHALLMEKPGRFKLSPAFDILPHLDAASIPQSIGVGAAGAASTVENIMSQCQRFQLKRTEAASIVSEVQETVSSQWRKVFADSGVSRTDIHTLSSCFKVADSSTKTQIFATIQAIGR